MRRKMLFSSALSLEFRSEFDMSYRPAIAAMGPEEICALAPSGVLRVAINMANFLLVSERTLDGGPAGVSPDMAAAIASNLGLRCEFVPYANPGLVADAASQDAWDIALIGAEPQRAETIAFTPAYAEIEATYMVPAGSRFHRLEDVDSSGARIVVAERTAYGLWLDRHIRSAELVRVNGLDGSLNVFRAGGYDALAGLRPGLISAVKEIEGARVLEGRFMAVKQAVGVPRNKAAATGWLTAFVEAARTDGFVEMLIAKYGIDGLTVA